MAGARLPGGPLVLSRLELPESLVFAMAVILAALLAAVGLLTLGQSLRRAWGRRREDAVREPLRNGLLERLYGPEAPDWAGWVADRSTREKSVLESLLDGYLRELDGDDVSELRALGEALGIPERARRRLRTGGRYGRLRALTWLALLRDPPDRGVLETHCTGSPRERAAAARVLYLADDPDIAAVGVDLLLADVTDPLPVFGIDTLYRVSRGDPSHLFSRADADAGEWDPALLAQVLLTCRQLSTVIGGADLSWVVEALESPAERTRVEAARTLGRFGWHRSLRDCVDPEAVCSDPSPAVRAAGYRMLSEWGDEAALSTLRSVVATEPDERARVAAAEAIHEHRSGREGPVPGSLADALSWVGANAAFDEAARNVDGTGG
ncbi:MAG: HEAT repeat domain-containing protein [Halobacteriales archaeon]